MASRFHHVVTILDQAVGGAGALVGAHGAFWRGVTRNQFVTLRIFGRELIAPSSGARSNLVKALKGEPPFGADLPDAPSDAVFNRMPAGRDPVSPGDIAFIERWIDDGCPEDEMPSVVAFDGRRAVADETVRAQWRRTNAPVASSRTDDIWFFDERIGWAVNSNGHVLKTVDGGESWERKFAAGAYLRCISFSDPMNGWVGTLTSGRVLYRTVDGGETWTQVTNLPARAPVKVCGLAAVSRDVVIAAGTNEPLDPPRMMKTIDGGRTWTAWDMRAHAAILIDVYFVDELRGWVVGGKADVPNPTQRDELKPVVLFTEDGGKTWVNRLEGQEAEFPFGEWGWKIQFLNDRIGFVSLENFFDAAILKTADGGRTFTRLRVNDPQGNANLEGVGFLDEQTGWVGGWGDADFQGGFSSVTDDGGRTWRSANEIGKFLNRFRFIGNPPRVGYASGDTVYKYTAEVRVAPGRRAALRAAADVERPKLLRAERIDRDRLPVIIQITVPPDTKRLSVDLWTRFGTHLGTLVDERRPAPGERRVVWNGENSSGQDVADGTFILRVTADDDAESSLITLRARRRQRSSRRLRWTRSTVTDRTSPARFFAFAADEEAPLKIELPDFSGFPTAIEKAKLLLHTAAEVEHALLAQYLYAAYSLKKPGDVAANPAEAAAVRRWKDIILEIAREEMSHLLTVQNLLILLKQPLNLEREDFPQALLYPFKLQLEPLTRRSLAKYVVAESPVDAADIADIIAEATQGAGQMPNHVGILYALLGVVFSPSGSLDGLPTGDSWDGILREVASRAYEKDADRSHWHLDDHVFQGVSTARQAVDAEWAPSGNVRIFSPQTREAALAALKDIAVQGEGPTPPGAGAEVSHFHRFLAIYRGGDGVIPFPNGEWVPSLDVPTNPRVEGNANDSSVIHAPKARDIARLADMRYGMLLGWLEQSLLLEPEQRVPLIRWTFAEMAALKKLSEQLTLLPRAGIPGAVAALPFSLPRELHLPAALADQWALHTSRLNEALALIDSLLALHGPMDSRLRSLLTTMKAEDQERLQFALAAGQGQVPSAAVTRWSRVQQILDSAAGTGNPGHDAKRRFWRLPLAEFVQLSIQGHVLIAPSGPDRGKRSNLVMVLRGEPPFENLRMPLNRQPISDENIAFIEKWIDDGCPEN